SSRCGVGVASIVTGSLIATGLAPRLALRVQTEESASADGGSWYSQTSRNRLPPDVRTWAARNPWTVALVADSASGRWSGGQVGCSVEGPDTRPDLQLLRFTGRLQRVGERRRDLGLADEVDGDGVHLDAVAECLVERAAQSHLDDARDRLVERLEQGSAETRAEVGPVQALAGAGQDHEPHEVGHVPLVSCEPEPAAR